jgi:2-polyprenyl-3-methyl-5-hydroxy-6-metoxy-1,4-benzoquinol methylase
MTANALRIAAGKPAAPTDRIVRRRVNLVRHIADFCGADFSLVDVGCGNGSTLAQLAGGFRSCTGMDLEGSYRAAFESAMAGAGHTHGTFRLIDLDREEPPDAFDRMVCFEVIEHFQSEQTACKLVRMLKPGGLAAISVPNKWWVFETHGANLPFLPWNRVPLFSWLPRPLHERWARARIYTRRRIVRLLERSGFRVRRVSYITAPLDVLPEGRLKRMLTRTLFRTDTTRIPFLATSIFLECERPS